ncbi:MAG: N-acetyltransferase family protein [Actinobacteria bacterium]|nr:MAG: N-acetyltransferase family protein [Actinomycetota bacterium]
MLELGARLDGRPAEARAELRALVPADWPASARIYWDGIRSGLATFETEVPTWGDWDAEHLDEPRLVATVWDEVVGWAALSPVSSRRCYRGVVEDSVYVADGQRGSGIGRLLLDALVRRAETAGIWTVQASIFPENRASVALHLRCGFRIVGARERIGRRDGLWRDTLLLERRSAIA